MPVTKKSKLSIASSGKGKGRARPPPAKRAKLTAKAVSNRPNFAGSDSDSASGSEEDDQDEDAQRQAMLAALQAHQASFLAEALPVASTSKAVLQDGMGAKDKPKEVKSVWDMGMEDLEEDSESEDEEEEEEGLEDSEGEEQRGVLTSCPIYAVVRELTGQPLHPAPVAEVVAFSEPGRNLSGPSVPQNKRDLRDFMSTKVKVNVLAKPSVADLANVKYRGGKAKASTKGGVAGKADQEPEDAAEESHLSSLDSHLSSLIKPLTSGGASQLPDLLRELPLAPTKPLKGHTPLPKNAPRTLRRGQNAANLKRAQARDAAAGVLAGQKRGREALTLKEKRREEGSDKRERGLKGAVGKWGRGQISLSRDEVRRVNGMGQESSGGGGKGGKKGRR
ncbi:hypothetical protein JCM5296_003059 [Sporobolomyces johnsonii]